MTIAAVVLAAGISRRLGRPKQSIVLAGKTLLERAVAVAREAGLSPLVLVLRKEAEDAEITHSSDLIVITNHDADEGVASSIRRGITSAGRQKVAGAVILTCDQPALHATHLRALVQDQHRLTGSAYGGTIGVPAYFPVEFFPSLLQLRGDTGARHLLKNAHAIQAEELSLDIDTETDLDMARTLFDAPGGDY